MSAVHLRPLIRKICWRFTSLDGQAGAIDLAAVHVQSRLCRFLDGRHQDVGGTIALLASASTRRELDTFNVTVPAKDVMQMRLTHVVGQEVDV